MGRAIHCFKELYIKTAQVYPPGNRELQGIAGHRGNILRWESSMKARMI
jgi:hypothetical protein